MDKTQASEACDAGSIPAGGTCPPVAFELGRHSYYCFGEGSKEEADKVIVVNLR